MKLLGLLCFACVTTSYIQAQVKVTPPAVPTKPADCVVKSADVAFVIDASGSVTGAQWKQSLDFATNIVKGYDIGTNKVRVGLVVFSDTSKVVFDFNKFNTKAQLVTAIANAPKESGGTNTHLGLNMARDLLFQASSGMRANVPNMLFVITDGASNTPASTAASAATLHARNITVFAVGVSGAKPAELKAIASKPTYIYNFQDFNKLAQIQDQFNKETCKVAVKLAPTTPPPPPTPACVVKSADIAFVIDASGSVNPTQWKQSLDFATNIVKGYDIGKNKVRVGLIVFSDTSKVVFDFNKFNTKAQLVTAIANAPKESSGTNTHLGLNMARDQLFQAASGMRANVPNMLFVITDGASNTPASTAASAATLHARNITVFAVGVSGAKPAELKTIASNPTYIYNFKDFNKLAQIQDQFNKETCKVAVKLAPPTTPKPKDCVVTADIAFVVDASGSVDNGEWKKSLDFAANVVNGYDIGTNQVRVALIEFSSGSQVVFHFNKFTTKAQVIAAIRQAPKSNGGTNTNVALDMAKDQLFKVQNGMRPNVPNILFVITDGSSNSRPKTAASAKLLHAKGITVFAIGVSNANLAELNAIASKQKYVYNFKDFNKLAQIQDQFTQETCNVAKQLATAPPPTPTRPAPVSGCTLNKADIVFVVDTSSSVGEVNFNLTKRFLLSMMEKLDFTQNRVGMVKFNDKISTAFELNQNNDLRNAQRSVDSMNYDKGPGTAISKALKHVRENSFSVANGDRPTVPNIAILLTDGQGKDPFRTQYEGNLTKADGIKIFSVGVGSDINKDELRGLASSTSFVYLVQSFVQLTNIRDMLANTLCQGFSLPPTTTPAPCLCRDKEKDCAGYGVHICFDAKYRTFAEETCPSYCDLCKPGCKRVLPLPKPCKDTIPDCDRKVGLCTEAKYKKYALQTCPRYCRFCPLLNPAPIVQTTTPAPPTTPTTTPAPTTGPGIKVPPKPTPFVICDPTCYDKARDCADYDKSTCKQKQFETFFRANCAQYCDFCIPKASCQTTPAPCVDAIDCSSYADSSCVSHRSWALKSCRKRCGFCPGGTPVTLPPVTVCEDLEDCSEYSTDMCTDFKQFAALNCRRYCKICTYTGPTTTEKCVNKRDCSIYKPSFCRDPDYRKFMITECPVFCNLCGVTA